MSDGWQCGAASRGTGAGCSFVFGMGWRRLLGMRGELHFGGNDIWIRKISDENRGVSSEHG